MTRRTHRYVNRYKRRLRCQKPSTYNNYFVTVLIRQQRLGFLLISCFCCSTGMLSGRASSSGQVTLLLLVQLSHLTTGLVCYNGVQLEQTNVCQQLREDI